MTDYIDRQAAIDAIEELILPKPKGAVAEGINSFVWRCAINCAEERIGHLPSIEPVKHGRWIDMDDHVMCSCCGATHYGADKNYCPNCGAQMEGR